MTVGPLRIANASGFYGDRFAAVREMLEGGPIDVLTGDYLAELTMLILGRDRLREPSLGYAKTFLRQMEDCLGLAAARGVKIVTNAGGLNPAGLAEAVRDLAVRLDIPVSVSHVAGDDLLPRAPELGFPDALTANAYLGAFGVAECLRAGADVVITGRVTDASLVVGPAAAHFGWGREDWDALAGATLAGHVLECGAQATGGNYAFFTELDARHPGFPIAELHEDGSSVITKHPGTGGAVTVETVTAQLLYEIEHPAYPGPDVTAHFDTTHLETAGADRVRLSGTVGSPPPDQYKVCVNTLGGFRNSVGFVLCGLDIDEKAALVREQLEAAVGTRGLTWRLARTARDDADSQEAASAVLQVTVKDTDADRAGRWFSRAAIELALASYAGFSVTTPPTPASPYGVFRAAFVPADAVEHVAVTPSGDRIPIPPPPAAAAAVRATPPPPAPPTGPPTGPSRRLPLGHLVGARSGDKGGDANVGLWARGDEAYAWLWHMLSVSRFRELLPEVAGLAVERYELPNLRALNFVVRGLLGDGVAASTRFDPQAKALGEWLRSRYVDIPEALL